MRHRQVFSKLGGNRLVLAAVAACLPLLAVALVLLGPAGAQAMPPVSTVSDKIVCQCGCNAVLSQCPHEECGWGVPARQFIAAELDKGRTPAELTEYFVSQYGEQILSAPTKRGFNLAAWLTPFVALIVGAVAVYFLVTTWAKRRRDHGRPEAAGTGGTTDEIPEELIRRLETELEEFD